MFQFKNITIKNPVKPFTSFCLNKFPSAESALDTYYSEMVEVAAQVEALLDEPIELDEQWHYLPNLDGRRDGKQSYQAKLRTYNDGLTLPIVFFKSFRHGGTSATWSARQQAWEEFQLGLGTDVQSPQASTEPRRNDEYEARRKQALQSKLEGQKVAGEVARKVWGFSSPCSFHPYLHRKKVESYGLRMASEDYRARLYRTSDGQWHEVAAVREGDLLVPMYDRSGQLQNLQRIDADGTKRFLLGGATGGARFIIPGSSGRVVLAEGYATGATWHESTNDEVIVCFSAGNLEKVAASTHADLVVADNDKSGAGEKAARATGLPYTLPPQVGADWNDYACEHGIDALRVAIAGLAAPFFPEPYRLPNPPRSDTPTDVLWSRLEKTKDCQEAATLAWALSKRLSLHMPMLFDPSALMTQVERRAPLGLINPNTLRVIRDTLEWILRKRQYKALSAIRPSTRVLRNCKVDTVKTLPSLSPADYHGVIIVHAPMGSGKTQNIGAPFARWAQENGSAPFLAICHRQSMVYELSRRLKCAYYKDKATKGRGGKSDIKGLATCLPSLPKEAHLPIVGNAKYVFIDEITQVLRSLASKVSVADGLSPADVLDTLRSVISQATCIIAADAGLDDRTIEFLRSCRPKGEEIRVIEQQPEPTGITMEFGYGITALRQAYAEATARLQEGQRLWIACGSKKRAIELAKILSETGKKVLLLHADNRADERQSEFWRDPEEESRHYDAVISTSVVASGLSIEHRSQPHFNHGMLITGPDTITPADAIQMLRRVRYLKSGTIIVVPGSARGLSNYDGIIEGLTRAAALEPIKYISPTDYDKLVVEIEATDNSYREDFGAGLWWCLEAQGFKIVRRPPAAEMDKDELATIRRELAEEKIKAILSTPDIGHEDALALRNTPDRTEAQSTTLLRYRIRTSLNVPWGRMEQEDIQVWDEGRGPRRMDRFSAAAKGMVNMAEKNSSSPHLKLHKFPKAMARSYASIFAGIELKPGLVITKELAESVLHRVAERRHMYAYLGIVPKKWGKKVEPRSAYPIRDISEILGLMGLQIKRHESSKKEDAESPVRTDLPRCPAFSKGEKGNLRPPRARFRYYVLSPDSWAYMERWSSRRNSGRLTTSITLKGNSACIHPFPEASDSRPAPPKLSYLDAGRIEWM